MNILNYENLRGFAFTRTTARKKLEETNKSERRTFSYHEDESLRFLKIMPCLWLLILVLFISGMKPAVQLNVTDRVYSFCWRLQNSATIHSLNPNETFQLEVSGKEKYKTELREPYLCKALKPKTENSIFLPFLLFSLSLSDDFYM